MDEQPYFPEPGEAPRREEAPYRTAAPVTAGPRIERSSGGRVSGASAERLAEAAARRLVIDEVVAANGRRRRNARLRIVLGLSLALAGVVVTFVSRGGFVWYGAVLAGVLMAVRGGLSLAGLAES